MTSFTSKLKKLVGKATPGEWVAKDYSNPGRVQMIWDVKDGRSREHMCMECVKPDDAAFICFMANHREDFVALVEALEMANALARGDGASQVALENIQKVLGQALSRLDGGKP